MPQYDVTVTLKISIESQPDVETNTIVNLLADIITDGPSDEYWINHVEDISVSTITKY